MESCRYIITRLVEISGTNLNATTSKLLVALGRRNTKKSTRRRNKGCSGSVTKILPTEEERRQFLKTLTESLSYDFNHIIQAVESDQNEVDRVTPR